MTVTVEVLGRFADVNTDGSCPVAMVPPGSAVVVVRTTVENPNSFQLQGYPGLEINYVGGQPAPVGGVSVPLEEGWHLLNSTRGDATEAGLPCDLPELEPFLSEGFTDPSIGNVIVFPAGGSATALSAFLIGSGIAGDSLEVATETFIPNLSVGLPGRAP